MIIFGFVNCFDEKWFYDVNRKDFIQSTTSLISRALKALRSLQSLLNGRMGGLTLLLTMLPWRLK